MNKIFIFTFAIFLICTPISVVSQNEEPFFWHEFNAGDTMTWQVNTFEYKDTQLENCTFSKPTGTSYCFIGGLTNMTIQSGDQISINFQKKTSMRAKYPEIFSPISTTELIPLESFDYSGFTLKINHHEANSTKLFPYPFSMISFKYVQINESRAIRSFLDYPLILGNYHSKNGTEMNYIEYSLGDALQFIPTFKRIDTRTEFGYSVSNSIEQRFDKKTGILNHLKYKDSYLEVDITLKSKILNKFLTYTGIGIAGIMLITSTIYITKYVKVKKSKGSLRAAQKIIADTSRDFQLSDMSLALLLYSPKNMPKTRSDAEIRKLLPEGILKFRYLLHPVRLTMMKLLYHEISLRSAYIKRLLNISWGDFATHSKSLQEKGYIEIKDTFDDEGSKAQIVTILDQGRNEFEELLENLSQFVQNNSPYQSIIYDDDRESLYPSN